MPLTGVWKLSVALSRRGAAGAAPRLPLPRRLRLLEDGPVEVPYEEGTTGRWTLREEAPPDGARLVRVSIERAQAPSLHLLGLYDGERIAGSITASHADAAAADESGHEEVGEFLCTRLFSFWGTPKPRGLADAEERDGGK